MKKIYLLLAMAALSAQAQFTQKPLPYAYNALEPYVDAATMEIHYSKHHAAYVKNLNAAVAGTAAEKLPITDILAHISQYSAAVRNNAGGHYNHEFFWSVLGPNTSTRPSAALLQAIDKSFQSFDNCKALLSQAGLARFGSGWVWLYVNAQGQLAICSTANQDNPLMDVADNKGIPILGIDVWEHAYYLKYQNKRGDYLSALWNVINWDEVSKNYQAALSK